MKATIDLLLTSPRIVKKGIAYLVDICICLSAYFISMFLTVKYASGYTLVGSGLVHLLITTSILVMLLTLLGFYRTVNRFVSIKILISVFVATFLSSLAYYFIGRYFELGSVSLASTVLYGTVSCILLGGSRLLIKSYYSSRYNTQKKRVVIYGAGSAGRQLATSLHNGNEFYVVAFVDDDRSINNAVVQGIRVYPSRELNSVVKRFAAEKVLLALPSVARSRRKEIISRVEKAGVAVQTIPGMADIVAGNMKIDEFQDVEIEDLLGRDPVPPVKELMDKNIRNKSVMVTGAGGSIGSELCRQIVELAPRVLILYEISEFSLYQIEKQLIDICKKKKTQIEVKAILGSVQDKVKVEQVLKHYKIDTVYHAAAYKHVPMVEHNVSEGIKNNIFGTHSVASASINAGVQSFVLISTDKAVRPTNVMGASKRFAELVLQGLATKQTKTIFSMVRFGNVLGSSGSVVPLFKKQIKEGGPVTVTHPEIIRYFMTIPEAAQLVIQAGAMAKGGDVFVLDMGEPVKILELAERLIGLMGLEVKNEKNPDGDIAISFTGLRPGEKLYEELLIGDNVEGTMHSRILTAREKFLEWEAIEALLAELDGYCETNNQEKIRELLLRAPTDYKPNGYISDHLWCDANKENDNKVIELSQGS